MILEKYESTGNDFIITHEKMSDPSQFAKNICNRHFGIGADGMMIAEPSTIADLKMVYFNSDGSIAPMCGNGIRAFIDYAYQNMLIQGNDFEVETLAGIMKVSRIREDYYQVNLGKPSHPIDERLITKKVQFNPFITIEIDGLTFQIYPIFLGTFHGVVLINQEINFSYFGEKIVNHPIFPKGININFAKILNPNQIEVVTFERGAGLTLSCGTGVSSTAYILNQLGLINHQVEISVPGGRLDVLVDDDVFLFGPTKKIATIITQEKIDESN